jgi:hypothetical protein
MNTKLTKNEQKLLLLAYKNHDAVIIELSLASSAINLNTGMKKHSPELLHALEGLCKKKYVDCNGWTSPKTQNDVLKVTYQLTAIGREKIKLLRAGKNKSR